MNTNPYSSFANLTPGRSQPETNSLNALLEEEPGARRKGKTPLDWWYHMTAPADVPETAPLAKRESVRRGRLISAVMFFAAIMFTLGFLIGLFGPNHFIAVAVLFPSLMIVIAALFNRCGKTGVAGIILPIGLNLTLIAVILSTPLTPSSIQIYDLLVFVEIFAISLLPPNGWILTAFVVFNLVFIQVDISLQRHTQEFVIMMLKDNVTVRARPIVIHVTLACILWLWVKSAHNAIARADRAEVIARLEHVVAEQEHVVALQKKLLEQGIQDIVETHMRVANGNLGSRVPLSSGSVLWPVAGPLNNLLARFQRINQEIAEAQRIMYEFQRVKNALAQGLYRIKMARSGCYPGPLVHTHTIVDPLLESMEPFLQAQNAAEGHRES